ncbi:MAG TPA: hypothetical protein VJ123_06530 [Anaerolineales bacterium]|nr:hypothetical protein [Anaerolineales bacterium]
MRLDLRNEAAVRALSEALAARSLTLLRSFDLRLALTAHEECACPYHGTAHCTCQYVILLVYGDAGEPPAVLSAHSFAAQTDIRFVQTAEWQASADLQESVNAALLEISLVGHDSLIG